MYSTVFNKEKAKLKKRKSKKRAKNSDTETTSDDESVALIEVQSKPKKRKAENHADYVKTQEEVAFLKSIHAESSDESTSMED